MDTLTTLNLLYGLATFLVLGSALGLCVGVWRARRAGDATIHARTLQRPWLFAWLLMAVGLVAQPVLTWWLTHTAGWSLGQTWLLAANSLFVCAALAWAWLLVRLNRLRADGAPTASLKLTLGLALFSGLALVVIALLMAVKPV